MSFSKKLPKNILITGGAGFIGSHLVRLLVNKYPDKKIINLDKLTYAGNLENLQDVESNSNYFFEKADICDEHLVVKIFASYKIDGVIHLAAESHVDRSITNPFEFAKTNVIGTLTILQVAKESWKTDFANKLFYHVSTDEVYGSLGEKGFFVEKTPYAQNRLILLPKHLQTTLCELMPILMGFRLLSLTVLIIMDQTNSLRSFCLCLLAIFSRINLCLCMERGKISAIGFM